MNPNSPAAAIAVRESSIDNLRDGGSSEAPIRRQYLQIKRRFPDTILLFRLGDFYETFEQDAEIAARVLDIMLTSRELGKGVRVALAGIPHHAADGHIAKLVGAGYKVAICEQLPGGERGRGLIDRDVTRVVTPGTVTDPGMLDSQRNCYIVAVTFEDGRAGVAFADLSTGEFAATQFAAESSETVQAAANRELLRLGAVEIVVPAQHYVSAAVESSDWLPDSVAVSRTETWHWTIDRATSALLNHFAVESLDGFGLSGKRAAIRAAGALLAYLSDTQRSSLSQITSLRGYSVDGFMELDAQARRNLELVESSRGEKRHGLIAVLDETCTPLGARMLRRWLSQPLLELEAIRTRQDAVQRYFDDSSTRVSLRQLLGKIGDIERLANRAVTGVVAPRELSALRQSLSALPQIASLIAELSVEPTFAASFEQCITVRDLLEQGIADDPPTTAGGGGVIRPGFAAELDQHETSVRDARSWIAGLERQERERTGIRSLKVGYNRVFGYYIEISNSALATAASKSAAAIADAAILPSDYIVRQSLANGTRYVTAELKEAEARVIGAQEHLAQLETDLYRRLVAEVAASARDLLGVAAVIAFHDVVSTLAEVAVVRGYVRPTVNDSLCIDIRGGRHPTLETLLPSGEFVPNDALLDGANHRITILTGPNMAGKSSWLRQVALIVLLAQIGSFVPASSAHIGLVDRIFTRIGAQDDIASGQSTFMVEMLETANILHHATPRSLVLLDEIGRGTSTWDGLAIARAVVEYLHNATRLGCRTLFATHFHEMTALASHLPGVTCVRMEVLEEGDRVVFLHQVVPGAADRSYGIHVAEIAGIPRALTRRAREILTELERSAAPGVASGRREVMATPAPELVSMQLTMFGAPSPVDEAVRALDVESLSPLEALTKLYELRQLAMNGEPEPS